MKLPFETYQQLELIEQSAIQTNRPHGWSIGQRILKAVLDFFIPVYEPVIHLIEGQEGELLWSVYDPDSKTHQYFVSESEVRCWLENRR